MINHTIQAVYGLGIGIGDRMIKIVQNLGFPIVHIGRNPLCHMSIVMLLMECRSFNFIR